MSNIVSGDIESCKSMYPVVCTNVTRTFDTCNVGIVACDENTGACPFLFKESATQQGDVAAGAIAVLIALVIIALTLFVMIKIIHRMLVATPVEVIHRMTNINNYVTMSLGCSVTILVGSSSLTESILNPFLVSGIVELEQVSFNLISACI